MADPGFSQMGRGANLLGPGYDFIKISRKLHEIEKNLVARVGGGGAGVTHPYTHTHTHTYMPVNLCGIPEFRCISPL